MNENSEETTRLTQFTNVIHVLFVSNSLFLLMSSPFFFHVLFISVTNRTIIWFLLSALTIVPALSALVYVMLKFIYSGEVRVFYHFFHSYRENFKRSLAVGGLNVSLGSLFLFNFFYLSHHQAYSRLWLLLVLMVLASLIVTLMYQLIILTRFNVSFKGLISLSWLYLIKYGQTSLRNLAIFLLAMLLASFIPVSLNVPLLTSSVVFVLLLNMKGTLQIWEKESRANQDK